MSVLAPQVQRWSAGNREVLWQRITGRHIPLDPRTLEMLEGGDPRMEALRRRMRSEFMLADGPQPDVMALIPVRSRLVLLLPKASVLWAPAPEVRTAGGYGYREIALDPAELAAWRAINDSRNTATVAARAGVHPYLVMALLRRLTASDVQVLQLRTTPPRPRDPSLQRMVSPPRPDAPRTAEQRGDAGETTLSAYHLEDITDGETHFDDRETTIAHALATPHPSLGGRPFGQALFDALKGREQVPTSGLIVEVGCGTGEMAASFWLQAASASRRYLRIDLSPELLRTQRRRAPDTAGVLADGTRLPLRDGSVDLLLSNEVMADLAAVPWRPGTPGEGAAAEVAERVARYGLSVVTETEGPPTLFNLGAWKLVEEVARVLRPGGHAWLSEFGAFDRDPEETRQLDHPEVSVHFGHLLQIAEALGLEARCLPMAESLGLDLNARQLARHSHHALRARARMEGWHLPARAWTPEQLTKALPWPAKGLQWVPMSEEGPGPLVTRFLVLTLRRP
ncbi:MAG: class I SAM-dependent methyltransferase [Deltaproteobacteria bacterium]|nr:class I SAM-dependent methyltransferase [Deltaproteobacteria bacterium]